MICGLAAAAAAVHMFMYRSIDYAVDDAWIPARVARTLLESGHLTYDVTRAPVESFSSPVWVGLHILMSAVAPEVDPVIATRLLGGLFGVSLVGVGAWIAGSLTDSTHDATLASAVTGGVLATHPGLAVHAINGLETSAWLLCLLMTWRCAATPHPRGLALGCALLIWIRPEGVLLGPALAVASGWRNHTPRWVMAAPALSLTMLLGLRYGYYGEALPMTAYAKAPDLSFGVLYAGEWLTSTGVLALLFVMRWRPHMAIGAIALIAMTALSGGDWMPGGRRALEATVWLAIALGALSSRRRVVTSGAMCWLIMSTHDIAHTRSAVRWYHDAFADLGERIHATPDITRVAAFDIGRLGWHAHVSIHDLAGLTDRTIAKRHGTHGQKPLDAEHFDAQAPDMVILTTTNDPSTHAPRFHNAEAAVYEHLIDHPDYLFAGRKAVGEPDHILLFIRDDVQLPAQAWRDWATGR